MRMRDEGIGRSRRAWGFDLLVTVFVMATVVLRGNQSPADPRAAASRSRWCCR